MKIACRADILIKNEDKYDGNDSSKDDKEFINNDDKDEEGDNEDDEDDEDVLIHMLLYQHIMIGYTIEIKYKDYAGGGVMK